MEDKLFYSIEDAISFRRECPMCSKRLTPHRGNNADQVNFDGRFMTIKNEESEISMNVYNNQINIKEVYCHTEYETNYLGYKFNKSPAITLPWMKGGQLIIAMHFGCYEFNCCQYAYVTAFHLDLNECIFRYAYLNSEWISVEKNNDTYDINNNYSTNKTKYTKHSSNGNTNSCEIPLIPLDVSNPEETLTRLQKLIIFT